MKNKKTIGYIIISILLVIGILVANILEERAISPPTNFESPTKIIEMDEVVFTEDTVTVQYSWINHLDHLSSPAKALELKAFQDGAELSELEPPVTNAINIEPGKVGVFSIAYRTNNSSSVTFEVRDKNSPDRGIPLLVEVAEHKIT